MTRYLYSIQAEYWKFGRTWSLLLWMLIPSLLVVGHFAGLYLSGEEGYLRYASFFGHENPWYYLYQSYAYIQFLVLPLLTIFLAVSIVKVELKSEVWQSFSVNIPEQLWSKWLLMVGIIGVGLLVCWLSLDRCIALMSNIMDLPFDSFQEDRAYMSLRMWQLYPILITIGSLHFWLSLYSKAHSLLNISLPLLVLPLGDYTPYGLTFQWWRLHSNYLDIALEDPQVLWSEYIDFWPNIGWQSIVMIGLLHLIGQLIFNRKKSWILSQ